MALGEQGRLLSLQRTAEGRLDRRFFTAAHCGIYFTLGFATACAQVAENGAPFGMALVAAAGPGLSGVAALLGATLGYLASSGLEWGIRYVAAAVLVYTVAFVFHELPVYRTPFFMPAAAASVMAVTAWLGGVSLARDLLNQICRRRLPVSGDRPRLRRGFLLPGGARGRRGRRRAAARRGRDAPALDAADDALAPDRP